MIDRGHRLPLSRQAEMLGISRGSLYYDPCPVSVADLSTMRRIDALHLDYPFAGSRMLRDLLRGEGIAIGRERVTPMMRRMGIEAIYRRPLRNLSPVSLIGLSAVSPSGLGFDAPAQRRSRLAEATAGRRREAVLTAASTVARLEVGSTGPLAQIQDVTLHDAAACDTLVLDDAPILVRLAVLLPLGLLQKHGSESSRANLLLGTG